MPTSPTLTEQLAILGVHLPAWPEEPEEGDDPGDWIQRGQAYAEGVRLWRAQLRNAPESTKGVVDQLLRHLHDTGQLGAWDQVVVTAINTEIEGTPDYEQWPAFKRLISLVKLKPAQLIGIMLYMVQESHPIAASHCLQILQQNTEDKELNKQSNLDIYEIMISQIETPMVITNCHIDASRWIAAIDAHRSLTTLLATLMAEPPRKSSPIAPKERTVEELAATSLGILASTHHLKLFRIRGENTFSFEHFLTEAQLADAGLSLTNEQAKADILYSEDPGAIVESQKYSPKPKLIWNCEPLWLAHSKISTNEAAHLCKRNGGAIKCITHPDGALKHFWRFFLNPDQCLSIERKLELAQEREGNRRRILALNAYRKKANWGISFDNRIEMICERRTETAEYLWNKGICDVGGLGWKKEIAITQDRKQASWSGSKTRLLEKYDFSLAYENTVTPGYITEKLWQPIYVGSIPIVWNFYGSGMHTLISKEAVIDASEYSSVDALAEDLLSMSISQRKEKIAIAHEDLQRISRAQGVADYAPWQELLAEEIRNSLVNLTM